MNASCVAFANVSAVWPGSLAGGRRDSVTALSPIVSTPSGPTKRNAYVVAGAFGEVHLQRQA